LPVISGNIFVMPSYPRWRYYPTSNVAPTWVEELTQVFTDARPQVDSASVQGEGSDGILARLRPGLSQLGYQVEASKRLADKIERPVLFGDEGRPRVHYQIDAWLPDLGVVLEIEAGRGWMGNAFYRDLVRTSLIVNARYLAIGLMAHYVYKSGGKQLSSHDYENARDQLDALYASGRLVLPFDGVLLIGY
jgi:hypothetical protein